MKRRDFLTNSSLAVSGVFLSKLASSQAGTPFLTGSDQGEQSLYSIFSNPGTAYKPFVRWWWNGDKIEKEELARELRLLKAAGIGGVEINPIAFPGNETDDMGIPSVTWLSDEWIDLLQFTLKEAKSLNMTCDLIAGTGFPFGAEFLEDEERSQIVVIGVKKLTGPLDTEFSLFELLKEADPRISNVYTGRKMELLSVKLVPDPLNNIEEVKDISDQIKNDILKISVPNGKYAVYTLVRVEGFERVIVGAPGGRGPVLNHLNETAVNKYLNHITGTIQNKIGPLSPYIRSFFADSMELEGANWNSDMQDEFKKRRGYDIYPYLPFVLFKIGGMGNSYFPDYTADMGADMKKILFRMKYDWALTIAEIFTERFVKPFAKWCTDNKIKSRAQAYGRGYFLLEGSFPIDLPECETWLKYGIGKDIPESDFMKYPWHLGQGNTMINKYVSSAAHLKNKQLISSEELTNTDMVFNESLEIFKIAGDQSTISGVTHPVFHGFNYSPPNAPFPGWIRWGGYFNEKNTIWPYLNLYNTYRTRLSALLQQGTMFADIALLPPVPDMWEEFGAQNEPFPTVVYPEYQMLIWQAMHQNGNACDYVSEQVINDSGIQKGWLMYGNRKYHTVFLIEVRGINPATAEKLYDFVSGGGRVFCIEAYPDHSPGWYGHEKKDKEVIAWVNKMKQFPERFIFVAKPKENFCRWFRELQEKYKLSPYVKIAHPQPYITQVRYRAGQSEVFFFTNSSDSHDYTLEAAFAKNVAGNKQAWLWDAETGERFKLQLTANKLTMALGPAASIIVVFDKNKKGVDYQPLSLSAVPNAIQPANEWEVQLQHYDGRIENTRMKTLTDLKELPEYVHFAGTIRYKNTFGIDDPQKIQFLNLGKVYGTSKVIINGKDAGTQWYGNRVYRVGHFLKKGNNTVEVEVTTVMLNYMKSLKDNNLAQVWTNTGRRNQQLQSLGLAGPVKFC
jgi:hypothetical protein